MTASRIASAVAVLVLAAGAVAAGFAVAGRPRSADPPTAELPTATATVVTGTATQRVQVTGVLGFHGTYPVIHQGPAGIVVSTAAVGSTVDNGGVLYTVANQPVRLLLGAVPVYREFAAGMADGPDVRQLEQGLVALGADPTSRIAVDDHFDWATTAAVRRLQASWGLPVSQRTGRLPLGQVLFRPVPLRIGQVPVQVGTSVAADTVVLSATSTAPVVTAQVGADRQALVAPGDQVVVTVTGLPPAQGTVTAIGQAPRPDPGDSAPTTATVPVTVTVQWPAGTATPDGAPAQVGITTEVHPDVLLVPVAALLARPGGGYQLRLDSGGYVEVRPGLFDDAAGLVEVAGDGLRVGDVVRVPAS